jgi:hypothetical protein
MLLLVNATLPKNGGEMDFIIFLLYFQAMLILLKWGVNVIKLFLFSESLTLRLNKLECLSLVSFFRLV